MTGPTLLAARDALAFAACPCGHDILIHSPIRCKDTNQGAPCGCDKGWPDALLASGVVQTPASYIAGLAEDEALVGDVASAIAAMSGAIQGYDGDWTPDADAALTAIAQASEGDA